jgi:tyrosyl-tRNA synthetase
VTRTVAVLLEELRWRGMLHGHTPGLPARLASGRPIAGYNGFDPSAASLHVGNLVPIFGLIQLQRHGGRPVALVGGATGMVGDPSGRSSERNLLDPATLDANSSAIGSQLERYLDFSPGSGQAVMVNNIDWLGRVAVLDFLRDVGKHFTVPYMLAKDSVQTRLERGLSFTEFSYMLLQAADFEHLYRTMGVEMQMGGADQWGNITAGLELIRRRSGAVETDEPAHGLAYPLLLSPSGAKFGKSEGGESVWLDASMTSPFAFYQYWVNADDRDVPVYLRWFTLKDADEIAQLDAATRERPERREAQRALAFDITARTHGEGAARTARRASEAAFSREPVDDPDVLETLWREADGFTLEPASAAQGTAVALSEAGLVSSRSEARRLVAGGAVTVNGNRVSDPDAAWPEPVAGEWYQVAIGKKRRVVGRLSRTANS